MKCQIQVSRKNKKNISLSSAKFAHRMVSVYAAILTRGGNIQHTTGFCEKDLFNLLIIFIIIFIVLMKKRISSA